MTSTSADNSTAVPGIPSGVDLTGLDASGIDLNNHHSLIPLIIRLNAAFIGTIALIVLIRIYARLRILHRIWADDSLIISAGCCTIALSAICIKGTSFGLGRHEWDLDLSTVIGSSTEIVKFLLISQVLYATAVTLTKISIIVSYIRVFPTPSFHRLMYVTAAVIVALWICSVLVTLLQCDPPRAAWDFTIRGARCIPVWRFFYVAASVNIATDLLLCISPLPLCWKLRISVHERIILCLLFAVGFFATAASAIRLSQLPQLRSIDISYACVSSLNWSVVEVGTGIICASIPSLKPIAIKLFPGQIFGSQSNYIRQPTPATYPSVSSEAMLERHGVEMCSRT